MQRLFSTFADGWPGIGLLLLRFLTSAVLIRYGISSISEGPPLSMVAMHLIGIAAAMFLLAGLFTPVAGILASLAKAWIAVARFSAYSPGDPWIAVAQAILAITLAMTGPGAWSIDARRFGRKHFDLSD